MHLSNFTTADADAKIVAARIAAIAFANASVNAAMSYAIVIIFISAW